VTVAELIRELLLLDPSLLVYRDDDGEWGPLQAGYVEALPDPKPCFFTGEKRPSGVVIK
jgi:hypothetical protein